ncbi:putative Copine family protein [Blattamonas nauphoetae]|uniref:Copine family protein n=1 Tax=Blattamonas nauphoetae TaxID=2049346 RepID=A0ABQ9Y6C8_9EUKA|nr:putative Copine family protein [Blattamonas nauphoetae]
MSSQKHPQTASVQQNNRIEIQVQCLNLPPNPSVDSERFRVVMYIPETTETGEEDWIPVNSTEIVENNYNPIFVSPFFIDYKFDQVQPLIFSVYRITDMYQENNPKAQEWIGSIHLDLLTLLKDSQRRVIQNLIAPDDTELNAKVWLTFDEVRSFGINIGAEFRLRDLKLSKDCVSLFCTLMKVRDDGSRKVIASSDLFDPKLSSDFGTVVAPYGRLCEGNNERVFRIRVTSLNKHSEKKHIAFCDTNLQELDTWLKASGKEMEERTQSVKEGSEKKEGHRKNTIFDRSAVVPLYALTDEHIFKLERLTHANSVVSREQGQIRDEKALKPSSSPEHLPAKRIGSLSLVSLSKENRYSFLDFIRNNLEIQVVFAIDFTLSNGDPSNPNSLHYFHEKDKFDEDSDMSSSSSDSETFAHPRSVHSRLDSASQQGFTGRDEDDDYDWEENEYLQVIRSISVITNYDTDNLYPVFGFGALIPGKNIVSHCFPLNMNPANPLVPGIDGVIKAYKYALRHVKLNGPTILSQVLDVMAVLSPKNERGQKRPFHYGILLLLTDGNVTDLQTTVDKLVQYSELPLSIIVVGIGDEEDFSEMRILDSQLIPIISSTGDRMRRDMVHFIAFSDYAGRTSDELSRALLERIPSQVEAYFQQYGLTPEDCLQASGAEETSASQMISPQLTPSLPKEPQPRPTSSHTPSTRGEESPMGEPLIEFQHVPPQMLSAVPKDLPLATELPTEPHHTPAVDTVHASVESPGSEPAHNEDSTPQSDQTDKIQNTTEPVVRVE